jgi:hypothetical protein
MSAQMKSRDWLNGQPKKSNRMKQPIVLHLPQRNPVVRAALQRAQSNCAGQHVQSQGAKRRAERMALQRALKEGEFRDEVQF